MLLSKKKCKKLYSNALSVNNFKVYRFPTITDQAQETLDPPLKSFVASNSSARWKKDSFGYGGRGRAAEDTGRAKTAMPEDTEIPNPRKMKRYLDEYIISQDEMKIGLSVAIYNHYQRIAINSSFQELGEEDALSESVRVEKSNVLLLGPTGCGKTLTAKTVAQMLNVPFSMNDATSFTQAGYVGDDVEACISRLLQVCEYEVEKAERGIVFIDEIDKIARKSDGSNPNQRDVSGEGVQQGLLRMLEGTTVHVNIKPGTIIGKRMAQPGEILRVDTSNILFICSGAFIGLEKIVADRLNRKGSIGFESFVTNDGPSSMHLLQHADVDDVVKFGFIPELVARLPIFAVAHPLDKEELRDILVKPRNALLKQYQCLFKHSKAWRGLDNVL
ncbi:hypothetical protein HDU91_000675 [Kappamyces sp. JEL0680]|nr:hypothetical protein HDU91_000675 [Kappamyces sp. JEL0680]